jgi:FAD/FMN-containing dehydrogenase
MKSASDLFDTRESHRAKVDALVESFRSQGSGTAALSKSTSNLFRPRDRGQAKRLDVRSLCRTLSVDAEAGTADVEGMTTFEDFADACLLHGFVPPVVPELKTITVGGAITVLGMDVLCGDGVVRTCAPEGEHADLFHAIPNSYGSLGYVLRARIRLDKARPKVALEHRRYPERDRFLEALRDACTDGRSDFVEGVVFAPDDHVVTTARFVDDPGPASTYVGMVPYHESLRRRGTDLLATRDYLWRWDADWFWCSRAFGMSNPALRFLLGRWMLRSSAYWKILTKYREWKIEKRMHAIRRRLGLPIALREPVIQDLEIPFERCGEFLDFYHRNIDIRPCWVCPVVPRPSSAPWTLYPMAPGAMHLNFGFWESVPTREDLPRDHHNRLLEKETARLGGRKSLYSSVHYPEDEFWQIHDREAYRRLKAKYDPKSRFLDLWTKVARGR